VSVGPPADTRFFICDAMRDSANNGGGVGMSCGAAARWASSARSKRPSLGRSNGSTEETKMSELETQGIAYPDPDSHLGEALYEDEAHLASHLADAIEKGVRAQYRAGTARRDVHAKATGCVSAEFHVNDTLPSDLARGVFIPGKTYQAWIRFSNGSADPTQPDHSQDGRGMAIKLLDVPGEKLLDNQRGATTQDFILINHPVFFINDPRRYIALVEKAGGSLLEKLTIPFAVGLKTVELFKEGNAGWISNPLQVRYFSATPYQLGSGPDRQVVKYSVRPVSDLVDPIPPNPSHDYLTEAMQNSLRDGDVSFKFLVQRRTSNDLSVEDAMVEWPEAIAPFQEVATIRIPAQLFATPERDKFGEDLSFNAWHALPEHRPLGAANRLRKVVYDRISRVRHEMNGVERKEP
jgi:hypothetical protein